MKRISLIFIAVFFIASILYFSPGIINNDISVFSFELNKKAKTESENKFTYNIWSLQKEDTYPYIQIENLPDGLYTPIIKSIDNYLSDKEGTYGISFLDLNSGAGFGINDDKLFIAASTIKVPINLYLHRLIAQGKVNAQQKLTYTEEYYEEGTGIIIGEDYGTKHSIQDLSKYSIENSDNIAINMLIEFLGRDNILEFMKSIVNHPIDKEKNVSTPKDMTTYLMSILDFNKNFPGQGSELMNYLENTQFNDRIPVLLPQDVAIAHKIGTQVRAVHDVAIVFAKKPYILSVMSEEVDEETAPDIIAHISRMIYDFSQNQLQLT